MKRVVFGYKIKVRRKYSKKKYIEYVRLYRSPQYTLPNFQIFSNATSRSQ